MTHSVADYIMLEGKSKLPEDHYNKFSRCLSFNFDSRDPRRRSIPGMITSLLAKSVSKAAAVATIKSKQNLFVMRGGWTDKSSISMFETIWLRILYPGEIITLHDFDECDSESRRSFLNYYSALSSKTERSLKLVITSLEPNALTAELDEWPKINVDAYVSDKLNASKPRNSMGESTRFCPSEARRHEIQNHLERLSTMEPTCLDAILGLLFDHTGWPENPSRHSLSEFTRLLSLVSPSDKPEMALDKIIRSDENTDLLC